ncbi:glycosyltransferase family 4 protein [Scytonema sp. PCC 10023]|uniref:glycosyltransferase family 4 protein n=1 Tax=Scytonema sp. PCC 10023 TaxID=1680591 RepID=UPI0039C5D0C3
MYPFAVIARQIGARSETFIRRHMEDILPSKTVVVTSYVSEPFGGHWSVDCPILQVREPLQHNRGLKDVIRTSATQFAVQSFLKKHKVQVILGEFLHYSCSFFKLSQQLRIPFFAHAHGKDVSELLRDPYWQREYLHYKQAAGVITVSQASRARLLELGLEPDKVHVIPCGVDVPDEPFKRSENEIIRCLAVGRMVPKKAPILLLEAFRRAVQECPNLRLDYIGTGEMLPAVRQFIQGLDLVDKVTLHGGLPSEVVQQYMRKADIFLQHSIIDPDSGDEEGLPVSILESMACALPVVSTKHAGIPEAVSDQKTGFLVSEGDCFNMAQKIVLLGQDADLRSKMGFASWQRAKELFTWERERNSLLQVMGLTTH